MRLLRKITREEERPRAVDVAPGWITIKVNPIKPEPGGTIVLMAFRIDRYEADYDGSLMARLEHIDKSGEVTGWAPDRIGLDSDTAIVVTAKEWEEMFLSTMVNCRHCGKELENDEHWPSEHFSFSCDECASKRG